MPDRSEIENGTSVPDPYSLQAGSAAIERTAVVSTAATHTLRRWVRRGLFVLASVVILIAIYIGVALIGQTWFAPPSDPNLDNLAVIQDSGTDSRHFEIDSTPDNDRELLPGILSGISAEVIAAAAHPLDPLLQVAEKAQANIRNSIFDYEAIMINQVRVGRGPVRDPHFMQIKIRHPRLLDNGEQIPFSIYTKFIAPANMAGQEAIWVRGANNDRLIGHPPSGMLNLISLELDPIGPIAMKGNRYPIYEMGISRLLEIIIEKGKRDRAAGDCQVTLDRHVRVDNRPCLMLEIRHPHRQEPFDFHIAKIFIDLEMQIPVAYEGYDWPKPGTTEPILLEKYVYTQIKLNPGLTAHDFDPANPEYEYPDR